MFRTIQLYEFRNSIAQEENNHGTESFGSLEWFAQGREGKNLHRQQSALNAQYSFSTRFEDGIGTNPEELIAAAHAGCFSMALSGQLGNAGMTAGIDRDHRRRYARKNRRGFYGHKSSSRRDRENSRRQSAAFEKAAQNAKAGCPISRLLKAEITMTAKLVGERASSA